METVKDFEKFLPPEMRKPKLQIEDLPQYAKKSCKKCFGRGYRKMVNFDGSFISNEFCPCIWKSKKVNELLEKMKQSTEDMPIISSQTEKTEISE